MGRLIEVSWVVVAQLIMFVGGILLLSVITKNVSIETFGKYALLLTISSGISQVLFGGVNAATGRFYAIAAGEKTSVEYFYAVKYIVFSLSLIVCVIALSGFVLLKNVGLLSEFSSAVLLLMFALLSAYKSNLNRIQNAARLRFKVALFNAIEVGLKIGLVLLVVHTFSGSLISLFSALCGAVALVTFFQYRSLLRFLGGKLAANPDSAKIKTKARAMILFARTLFLSFFMIWVHQSSARWVLEGFSGTETVGGFMAVYQLCYSPMAVGFAALSSYLAPIMYQGIEENHSNENGIIPSWLVRETKFGYFSYSAIILLVCFLLIAFSAVVHESYFQMIVPIEYAIYSNYMGVALVAGFFTGLGEVLTLKLLADMRVITVRNIKLLSSSVGLAGNVIGAWLFGVQGVLLSMLFLSFLSYLLFLMLVKSK